MEHRCTECRQIALHQFVSRLDGSVAMHRLHPVAFDAHLSSCRSDAVMLCDFSPGGKPQACTARPKARRKARPATTSYDLRNRFRRPGVRMQNMSSDTLHAHNRWSQHIYGCDVQQTTVHPNEIQGMRSHSMRTTRQNCPACAHSASVQPSHRPAMQCSTGVSLEGSRAPQTPG